MDDDLIDDDGLSLSRKSRLPGAGFFYPDSLDEEYADRRAREAIEGAEAVVVADGDADGLGCAALVREMYDAALDIAPFEESLAARVAPEAGDGEDDENEDREESPVGLVTASPHSLTDALERVAKYADPGVDVYVCDLCPDDDTVVPIVEDLIDRAARVEWFDHHQWDDDVAAAVRAAGVDLVVGESDEECTVDVALRSLEYDFPEHLTALASVTRDHDLWIKEDPRSDDLADYAHWASAEEYVTVVGQYGPALPDPVVDFLDHRRVEKEQLIEAAVDRASMQSVGPWTVGVTYGRCSQNEVAEALREQGADAAVIVKPAGSASIRGSEGFERCHEVAGQVNGGGHPRAAGCKPDIYDDMLDYAHHWSSEGYATRQVILAAFERLTGEEAADGDE
ncbi:DHH family phosphoesterase [Haloplanus halobius]|uniref:DHH family phosphoesterase n=1 Tax=Haloplanus halobius TaxID=2934938 RepID=UPI00200F27D5|nr:phosphohydrolase [Haloplanus sp. XH21]